MLHYTRKARLKKVHKMRDNMKAFISISSKTPGWSILAFSISHIFPICAYHKLLKAAHSLRVIQDKSIDNYKIILEVCPFASRAVIGVNFSLLHRPPYSLASVNEG
jgi:hypothetical protein